MAAKAITYKRAFIVSLLINLLLIGASLRLVRALGGLTWVKQKLGQPVQDTVPRISGDPSWQNRRNVYDVLPVRPRAVILAGDSLTAFCPWNELLPGKEILNRGVSGDFTEGVTLRLDEILRHQPKQLFIMVGINDLWADKRSPDYVHDRYRELIERVGQQSQDTEIFVQSVLPLNYDLAPYMPRVNDEVKALNQKLQDLAHSKQARYLDLYSQFADAQGQLKPELTKEGLHLGGEGCRKWAELLNSYLK